jgi:hypothetical protein
MWMSSSSWRNGGKTPVSISDLIWASVSQHLPALALGQQADFGQHLGMGDRPLHVVGVEAVIEADAFGELLDAAIRRLGKHSAARWTGQRRPL